MSIWFVGVLQAAGERGEIETGDGAVMQGCRMYKVSDVYYCDRYMTFDHDFKTWCYHFRGFKGKRYSAFAVMTFSCHLSTSSAAVCFQFFHRFPCLRMPSLQTFFTVPSFRYQCRAVEGAWTQGREDRMSGLVPPIADSFIAHPPIATKAYGTDPGEARVLPDRGRH
jgi:hypothetical protein